MSTIYSLFVDSVYSWTLKLTQGSRRKNPFIKKYLTKPKKPAIKVQFIKAKKKDLKIKR